jgi:hypothetical protein
MPRPTLVRAWDYFWQTTQSVGLHRLGSQTEATEEEKAWVAKVDELGPLSMKQTYVLAELLEQTARIVKNDCWTKMATREENLTQRWIHLEDRIHALDEEVLRRVQAARALDYRDTDEKRVEMDWPEIVPRREVKP